MKVSQPTVNRRVHVGPFDWNSGATDYWCVFTSDMLAAMGATNMGVDGFSWVMTAISFTEAQTGDFLSSSDQTLTGAALNASGDIISFNNIFGSYAHALVAAKILGYTPTRMIFEAYGAFSTASANETATFFGLCDNGQTDPTAAGSAACIYSNGTNFLLVSDNGSDTGALIDTGVHVWKIAIDATNTEWFIDSVSQGTIATETDIWPVCPKAIASTTNRLDFAWWHLWYE